MGKYAKKRKSKAPVILLVAALLAALCALAFLWMHSREEEEPEAPAVTTTAATEKEPEATENAESPETSEETTLPEVVAEPVETEPEVQEPAHPVSSITIGALGDIWMDLPIINAYEQEDGSYQFDGIFRFLKEAASGTDYSVVSLESPLAGNEDGIRYSGMTPRNTPDSIVDTLYNTGFDMVLTGNNHAYDFGRDGLLRTLRIIGEKGMDTLGTSEESRLEHYSLMDIGDIRVGMMDYTIENSAPEDGDPSLTYFGNIAVEKEDAGLIASFLPDKADLFLAKAQRCVKQMQEQGAESIVVFLHWGTRYSTKANDYQKQIAQKLCDMGVDVIVGTHPHVVQPVELLTSTENPDHSTLCVYSLGNAVSNQRFSSVARIATAHTEDGLWLTFTLTKYSDGSVHLEAVEITPLWMYVRTTIDRSYNLLPLDIDRKSEWREMFNLGDTAYDNAVSSQKRTDKLIGKALTEIQEKLAAAVELRQAEALASAVENELLNGEAQEESK